MPVLLKKPWAGQPQGEAQLNPLLRRPALVWVGSNPFRSYNYQTVPALLDATATVGVGPGGRALKLATATPSRLALTTAAPTDLFPTGLADCTIAIVRRHTDTTARGATTFGSDIGASNRILLHAPFSDGNIYWDFGNATSGSGRASGAYGSKTTEVECIVAVAGQTKGREVWRGKIGDNPTRLVQNTSAKATMSNLVSNPAFSLGSSASTVIADNEEQYLFIVSYDEWSDEDIRQWCRDPWGRTFAEQTIFVPNVAATGYTLTAEVGSFVLTGNAAGLLAARTLVAAVGDFSLTGIDAAFARGIALTAESASFSLTGVDAALVVGRSLTAATGSFALTGNDAGLVYAPSGAYTLIADVGNFALTGYDAGLTYTPLNNYTLTAETGDFSLSGVSANLLYSGQPQVSFAGGFKKKKKYDHLDPEWVKGSIKQEEEEPQPVVEKPKKKAAKPAKGGALTDVKPVTLPPKQEEPKEEPQAPEAPQPREPTIQEIVEQALRKISAEVIGQLESYRKAEVDKERAATQQRADEESQRAAMKAQQESMRAEEDDVLTLVASIEQEPRQVLLKAYERAMKLMKSGL